LEPSLPRLLDLQDNEVQLMNKLEHLEHLFYKLVFVDICQTKCAKCVKSNLCHQTDILPQNITFLFHCFRDNMSIQFHIAVWIYFNIALKSCGVILCTLFKKYFLCYKAVCFNLLLKLLIAYLFCRIHKVQWHNY